MEAIKNYLDSMFANLPNTAEVRRAKDELWQMMEDKYGELMAEGKTENEAVGQIISEFGNLNDLAEELGLEKEVKGSTEKKNTEDTNASENKAEYTEETVYEQPEVEARVIPASEAEDFVKARSESSFKISLGVAICILSPLGPILAEMLFGNLLDGIGFGLWITAVAGGVILIVFGGLADKKYRELRGEVCTLSMDATKYVADERAVYMRNYNLQMTIGVMLCALSWIPAAILGNINLKWIDDLSGALFFISAAVGVMLIIYSAMRKNGYDKLLKLNGEGTFKATYEPDDDKNVKYVSPAAEFFMSVYWPTFTCLYLILSFVTFKWGLTWIIWPVSGILYKPLKRALTVKE